MGEHADKTQITDRSDASGPASDTALLEASAGMQQLVQERQQYTRDLKDGTVRSGVTGQIGKLIIVDNEKNASDAPNDQTQAVKEEFDAQIAAIYAANTAPQSIEYTNGVKTTISDGGSSKTKLADGTTVQIEIEPTIAVDLSKVQPQPVREELDKDGVPTGTILDGKGRPVCRSNEDGSVSVYERDDQGLTTTTTEYPDGVRIRTSEPRTVKRNGKPVVVESNSIDVPLDGNWQQKDDGSFVNKSGDTKIATNDDGSISVTTAEGRYTQKPNGSRTFVPSAVRPNTN